MERPSSQSHYSGNRFQRPRTTTKPSLRENPPSQPTKSCFRCEGTWPHNGGKCPTEGQRCNHCFKYNHFARVCQSRNRTQHSNSANAVQNTPEDPKLTNTGQQGDSTDSEEYSFNIHATSTKKQNKQSFYIKIKIGKSTIQFQIDSGSSANIIDESTFATIQKKNPSIQLTRSRKRLFAFGSAKPLPLIGQFQCLLESKKRLAYATIIVVKNATGCLLSEKTFIDFLTIKVNKVTPRPAAISKLSAHEMLPNRLRPTIQEFDEVFHGVGKLTDVQVHLHIDKNVTPVVQPTRRIPFALRQKVEHELEKLQENDIIEPSQGPTLCMGKSNCCFSQTQQP